MSLSSSSAAKAISSELIAFGILSRLPAKSVLRFKSVCKRWLALASDPFFLAAHTRCNPLTVSGFLIQEASVGPVSSFSVDGGASPVLPDPLLSSLNRRFADSCGIVIWQFCNGLLLCRTRLPRPPSSYFILNPTTMQYREIPDPPPGLYPFKYQVFLAFDPSTSFQYRIACLSSDITPDAIDPTTSRLHVEIYSSNTGAWELSRETLPFVTAVMRGVYWNGALNWLSQNALFVSFDVEQQVVKTTPAPPCHHPALILCYEESRGHLHVIGLVDDVGCRVLNRLRFLVFEMGKDNPSWSLKYIDLNGGRDAHPEINSTPPDENLLTILPGRGIRAFPFCFARGGEGEDDKLYLINSRKILCYNLAERTCRNIISMNSRIPYAGMLTQFFPVCHSLFSP